MRSLCLISVLATAVLAVNPRVPVQARRAELATPDIITRASGQSYNCSRIGAGNAGSTAGQVIIQRLYAAMLIRFRATTTDSLTGALSSIKIDPDGSCKSSMTIQSGSCAGYCEVRNYYFYGEEVPYSPFTACRVGDKCDIDGTYSAAITQSFSFNVGAGINTKRDVTAAPAAVLKGAFNIVGLISYRWGRDANGLQGASYTYQTVKTTSHGNGEITTDC